MKNFHAYSLEDWPRRNNGELIFTTTNEAIYYANLTNNRDLAHSLLKKWRKNAYQDIARLRSMKVINYNRIFDLAQRASLYRECFEELERLNKEGI